VGALAVVFLAWLARQRRIATPGGHSAPAG
jgi:hypothetical protein